MRITVLLSLFLASLASAQELPGIYNSNYGLVKWEDFGLYFSNRRTPRNGDPYPNALQIFHENRICGPNEYRADCFGNSGIKLFVNFPKGSPWDSQASIVDAVKQPFFTHTSGIYIQSFGQAATVLDRGVLIPPSDIHLEPWGKHIGLRIDGANNSGVAAQIEISKGSTGMAVFGSQNASPHCSVLGVSCDETTLLDLRGGYVSKRDVRTRVTMSIQPGMGYALAAQSTGVESFTHWNTASQGFPLHCVYNKTVTPNSIIRVAAFKAGSGLRVAHTYAVKDVWGPGSVPPECAAAQMIKTNSAGAYQTSAPAANLVSSGGFSVYLFGPTTSPLNPALWDQYDRPSFSYEVIEQIQ